MIRPTLIAMGPVRIRHSWAYKGLISATILAARSGCSLELARHTYNHENDHVADYGPVRQFGPIDRPYAMLQRWCR